MTKKRKAGTQTQEGPSDPYAELKRFIIQENEKCVREITASNDKRLTAIEDSLSFALDAVKAVSDRQNSADYDILVLQRETADLRRRLQLIELSEDRLQQEKRQSYLLFSGPALRAQTRREDAFERIQSVVREYMRIDMDRDQIVSVSRLKSGKVMIQFTSVASGSDRDVLFRSKTKLRGSGLFISESLTPRRQQMFADLLQLKREKVIFSVFTIAGNILVCRTRDAAPLRIADPEAVRQLAEPPRRPGPGRPAQVEGGGERQAGESGGVEQGRERAERRSFPPDADRVGVMSDGDSVVPRSGSCAKADEAGAAQEYVSPVRELRRDLNSSLMECTREVVPLVSATSPVSETALVGDATVSGTGRDPELARSASDRAPGAPERAGAGTTTVSGATALRRRREEVRHPEEGSSCPSMPVEQLSRDDSRSSFSVERGPVRERCSLLPSGGDRQHTEDSQVAPGVAGETDPPSVLRGDLSGEGGAGCSGVTPADEQVLGSSRRRPGDGGRGGGASCNRDIREFFF